MAYEVPQTRQSWLIIQLRLFLWYQFLLDGDASRFCIEEDKAFANPQRSMSDVIGHIHALTRVAEQYTALDSKYFCEYGAHKPGSIKTIDNYTTLNLSIELATRKANYKASDLKKIPGFNKIEFNEFNQHKKINGRPAPHISYCYVTNSAEMKVSTVDPKQQPYTKKDAFDLFKDGPVNLLGRDVIAEQEENDGDICFYFLNPDGSKESILENDAKFIGAEIFAKLAENRMRQNKAKNEVCLIQTYKFTQSLKLTENHYTAEYYSYDLKSNTSGQAIHDLKTPTVKELGITFVTEPLVALYSLLKNGRFIKDLNENMLYLISEQITILINEYAQMYQPNQNHDEILRATTLINRIISNRIGNFYNEIYKGKRPSFENLIASETPPIKLSDKSQIALKKIDQLTALLTADRFRMNADAEATREKNKVIRSFGNIKKQTHNCAIQIALFNKENKEINFNKNPHTKPYCFFIRRIDGANIRVILDPIKKNQPKEGIPKDSYLLISTITESVEKNSFEFETPVNGKTRHELYVDEGSIAKDTVYGITVLSHPGTIIEEFRSRDGTSIDQMMSYVNNVTELVLKSIPITANIESDNNTIYKLSWLIAMTANFQGFAENTFVMTLNKPVILMSQTGEIPTYVFTAANEGRRKFINIHIDKNGLATVDIIIITKISCTKNQSECAMLNESAAIKVSYTVSIANQTPTFRMTQEVKCSTKPNPQPKDFFPVEAPTPRLNTPFNRLR